MGEGLCRAQCGILNLSLCSLVSSSCRILFLFVKIIPRESSRSPHARCTVLLGSTVATTTPCFHLGPSLLTTFAWLCWILPRGVHRWYGKSSSRSCNKLFYKVVYILGGDRLLPALFCLQGWSQRGYSQSQRVQVCGSMEIIASACGVTQRKYSLIKYQYIYINK